jgi:CRP-like cAMP-binding protein
MEPQFDHELPPGPPTLTPGGNVPLELLRHQPFFLGLTDPELTEVAELMRPVSYATGDFVFRQGTAPDGLYVLESGEVLMWTRIGDMRRELIRFQPGSSLCLASIVECAGRVSSMECLKPSRAWVLDIRAFDGLLARRDPVALRILHCAAENMGRAFPRALNAMTQAMKLEPDPGAAPADPLPGGRALTVADAPLLNVLPFTKSLTAAQLETFMRIARWRDLKRGHRLFVRGGPPAAMQLVVRGALEASFETTEGKKRLSMRGPGTWAGVDAFAARSPQPCTVVVRENAALVALERDDLDRLYQEKDMLAVRLLQQIALSINDEFNHDLSDLLKNHVDRTPPSISSDELKHFHEPA